MSSCLLQRDEETAINVVVLFTTTVKIDKGLSSVRVATMKETGLSVKEVALKELLSDSVPDKTDSTVHFVSLLLILVYSAEEELGQCSLGPLWNGGVGNYGAAQV